MTVKIEPILGFEVFANEAGEISIVQDQPGCDGVTVSIHPRRFAEFMAAMQQAKSELDGPEDIDPDAFGGAFAEISTRSDDAGIVARAVMSVAASVDQLDDKLNDIITEFQRLKK